MCPETSSFRLNSKESKVLATRTAQSDNCFTHGLASSLCRTAATGLGFLIHGVVCVFLVVILLRNDSLLQQSFYSMTSVMTSNFSIPTATSCWLGFRLLLSSSVPASCDAGAAAISVSSFLLPPPLFFSGSPTAKPAGYVLTSLFHRGLRLVF